MKSLSVFLPTVISASKQTESPIEALLFSEIMRRKPFVLCKVGDVPTGEGYFVFPQRLIGPYRVDFMILGQGYLPAQRVWPPRLSAALVVECDGQEFHSTPEQKEYDKARDRYFVENGLAVMRLSGAEIHKNVKLCVDEIIWKLEGMMRGRKS